MVQEADYRTAIREAVDREGTFLRLTLSGRGRGGAVPWEKVVVRPVQVRGRRHLQFVYSEGRRVVTKNAAGDGARAALEEALALRFARAHVQAADGDLHVQVTKKQKVLMRRAKPSRPGETPGLAHNRTKPYPISEAESGDFLREIGIADASGAVRPTMQGKFRQVNEFVRQLELAVLPEGHGGRPLVIVDCGCGSAYLTFAAYHYLNRVLGAPARVVGVDSNAELIAKCRRLQEALGWEHMVFHTSRILDFDPGSAPDVVLSLHACDTATDEAIARGICWESRAILAAPCCQHELHGQVRAPVFLPVLRHGILKQRTADILTDAFRAQVLRIAGYRTDVVEFISPEYTARNLMIRALKTPAGGTADAVREYEALKAFWKVEPCLERLLGERFDRWAAG